LHFAVISWEPKARQFRMRIAYHSSCALDPRLSNNGGEIIQITHDSLDGSCATSPCDAWHVGELPGFAASAAGIHMLELAWLSAYHGNKVCGPECRQFLYSESTACGISLLVMCAWCLCRQAGKHCSPQEQKQTVCRPRKSGRDKHVQPTLAGHGRGGHNSNAWNRQQTVRAQRWLISWSCPCPTVNRPGR
jgi:hypothetical protein